MVITERVLAALNELHHPEQTTSHGKTSLTWQDFARVGGPLGVCQNK